MRRNFYVIVSIFLFVIVIRLVFEFGWISKKDSNTNTNVENVSWDTIKFPINQLEEKVEIIKNVELPEEYNDCKSQIGLADCILSHGEDLNSQNYEQKFEEVLKYKEQLQQVWENIDDVKDYLATQYSVANKTKINVLFQSTQNWDTQDIQIQGKKKMIELFINRWLIKDISFCQKVADSEVKQYCESFFNK